MTLEMHLRFVGLLLSILGPVHFFFPRRFGWKAELENVSLFTRQIFYVHHFFVALVVTLMGGLCLFCAPDLLRPGTIQMAVLGGIAFFWLCRLLAQFFVFDRSHWRGHRFNTAVHLVFALLWTYLVVVFGAAFFAQCSYQRTAGMLK